MSGYRPYPKYKPSDVEWLGDVPDHWITKAIKWESNVARGASPRPIDDPIYFDEDGEYAWVRIADVTTAGRYLDTTTQRLSLLGSSLSVRLQPGDLFLSIAGTVGKPCITAIKCCIHDGFVYFPSWESSIDFLYYVFVSGEPYKGLGKFGTQLNLNTDTVGGIKVALPPLPEQRQIASFLDRECGKLDDLQAKQEQLIELLKEKRQALISHAVTKGLDPKAKLKPSGIEWLGDVPEGWVVTRLRYVIRDLESGVSVNSTDTPADSDQLGVLKTSCVYTRQFRSDENKAVVLEELDRVRCPVKKNCLIISRMNTPELVGATGFVDRDFPNLFLPDRLWQTIFYHPSEEIARFFSYVMSLKGFRDEIGMISTGTSSSMKNIAKEDLLGLTVALPPSSELCAIVTHLEMKCSKVDNLIAKAESAISLMKERRSALISAAVTGKIDVREHSN